MKLLYRTIIYIILPILSFDAFAGLDVHVTIVNETEEPLTVQKAGHDCWYYKSLNETQLVPPNSSEKFLTEMKSSGSCFFSAGHKLGIDLINSSMNTHVELFGQTTAGPLIADTLSCASYAMGSQASVASAKTKVEMECRGIFRVVPK